MIQILTLEFFLIKLVHSTNACSKCTPEISSKTCACSKFIPDCVYVDEECLYCEGYLFSQKKYYKIEKTGQSSTCQEITNKDMIQNFKFVHGTHFFKNECPSGMKPMGNVCYSSQPPHTEEKNGEYVCKKYFYKETRENIFDIIHCLPEMCSSKFKYYNADTNECLMAPEENKKIKQEKGIIRYTDKCLSSEYEYSVQDTSGKTVTYCLDKCPLKAKYFTKVMKQGDDGQFSLTSNLCSKSCPQFAKEDECVPECEDKLIFINLSKNIRICSTLSLSSSCPNNYPNKYNNKYCLKSCQHTLSTILDGSENKKTYLLDEEEEKICTTPNGYYIDGPSLKVVKDCSKSIYGPFHNSTHCVTSCEKKVTVDTYECVESCELADTETKKYLSNVDNFCYLECPNYLGRPFKDKNNKKCQTCKSPLDSSRNQNEEVGYYTKEHDICYDSCDEIPSSEGVIYYHDYDNNFCTTTPCSQRHTYKYSSSTNPKVCYNSCSEINDGNKYSYEKDYICYPKNPVAPGSPVYYLHDENSKITKIFENQKGCLDVGFKFLKDSYCVKECSLDEYKILPTQNNLGACLKINSDGTLPNNCKYYNQSKICTDECNLFTIDDHEYITTHKENCVKKCPETLYENGNKCEPYCGSEKFHIDGPIKKCADKCSYYKISKTENNSIKKTCVDKCTDDQGHKSYYIDSGINKGKCVDSCKLQIDTNDTFSYDTTYNHQPCINKCPSSMPYYYDDNSHEKICLKICDKFYTYKNNILICTEQCNKGELILPGNICSKITECPSNAPYMLKDNSNIKCLSSCPKEFPFYLKSTKECVQNCDKYIKNLYSEEECYKSFPNDFYDSSNKFKINYSNELSLKNKRILQTSCPIEDKLYYHSGLSDGSRCIALCKDSGIDTLTFSYEFLNGQRICVEDCKETNLPYWDTNKICLETCEDYQSNNIINDKDNSCVGRCDLSIDNEYKFLEKGKNDEYLHCKKKCENSNTLRYSETDYICKSKCEYPNNYVVTDLENIEDSSIVINKCLSKCPEKMPYMRYDSTNEEYICSSIECSKEIKPESQKYNYFFMDSYLCMKNCGTSFEYINGTKKFCVSSCDFFQHTKLYNYISDNNTIHKCVENCKNETDDNQFSRIDGFCGKNCSNGNDELFYDGDDQICLASCPPKTFYQETDKKCVKCEDADKYIDFDGSCIESCSISEHGYIYHDIDQYTCLLNCSNKIIQVEDNTCINVCEKFIYEQKYCVEKCPISKKYYESQICLPSCSGGKKFYKKENINDDTHFECIDSCKAYVNNTDPQNNVSLCLDGKEDDRKNYYQFYYNDGDKEICSSACPPEYPYYKEDEKNEYKVECYSKCPDETVLDTDKNVCIMISDCKLNIDLINNTCLKEDCGVNDKIYINGDKTYCVKNCTYEGLKYAEAQKNYLESTDGQCVERCDETISTDRGGKCECRKLYYLDKATQRTKCININIESCDKTDYPITVNGTYECVERCQGTLSVSGEICYPRSYQCNQTVEEVNTLINGDRECKCKYKYYIQNNNIKCLSENENCPEDYKKLITETKECVATCPDYASYDFNDICVATCPPLTESEGDKKCVCQKLYYIDENNNPYCIENNKCPEDYPLLMGEKLCVKKCPNDKYLLFTEKKCVEYNGCGETRDAKTIEKDLIAQNYASNICLCKKVWYYNETTGNEECTNKDDCSDLNISSLSYMIYSTKQCVPSCESSYSLFGNQCFENCDAAIQYTEQNLEEITTDAGKKVCKCKEYSEYDNNTHCLTLEKCLTLKDGKEEYSVIEKIQKCYKQQGEKKCPEDYPIYFNGYCYKAGKCEPESDCPSNAEYNNFTQTFKCKYKWYIDENSRIVCLQNISNCSQKYPYLVNSTNQCLDKDSAENSTFYLFNYVFYLSCPENTIATETSKKCECNKNKIYYSYVDDQGKELFKCAAEKCPDIKPYLNYDPNDKECFDSCNGKFIYSKKCVEKCPNLTEVGINNECQLSQVVNDLNFDNLEQTMIENILELYSGDNKNSYISQKIATKDANIEFYGVNKVHRGLTQQNIESDLSYIDISGCIDKLYNTHGMAESESDIIVLKFDVNNPPDNFMINPVEYRFIDSKTGNILDATICGHNSIRLSYPLHYLINIYDSRIKKRNLEFVQLDLTSNNKESLREKLDKGKEIVEQYPDRDIFNMNDTIYSDICIPVVVDGKDLILKDRIDYFYPKMSFCENNCTYNYTDFVNERIYCDCNFKTEFDFKREYYPFMTIDEKITDSYQGGNSNIISIKCISNLKNLQKLFKNGGFIFMIVIIVVEVILLLIVLFYGINSLLNKLMKKMNDEEDDDISSMDNPLNAKDKKPKESESESMKSESESDRDKNDENNKSNPPKKKGDFGMEFVPQEYLFLFFNQNEKGVIKKVKKDEVPFKTKFNTRILLEQNKGVNYENVKSRGPFPPNQNVLVLVDNMDESISDYLYEDEVEKKPKKKKAKVTEKSSIQFDIKPKKKFGQTSDYDPSDENYSAFDLDEDESEEDEDHEKGFVEQLKIEQRLLNKNYKTASRYEKNSNCMIMLMAEILNLIYIAKILLFSRKFDILSAQLSIYLLCHTLLLVLIGMFYDVETISKIWTEENFPGLGYHLLYGFYACLVIWVIYKLILCLWSSNDSVKALLRHIHINKVYGYNNRRIIIKKYNELEYKIKAKVIAYFIIQFILLAFCFVYFVTFCSVYVGTKIRVFRTYGIALIEILIIKIIYGIILTILRKISLSKKSKVFYDIVLLMTTYLV
jgi:hypothetical protein